MVCHLPYLQRPCPRQRTRPFHPQLLQHINQRRCINQRKHVYHPLEVAEAEPTEAEDVEEVEVGDADNLVAIKIESCSIWNSTTSGRRSPAGGPGSDHRAEKLPKTFQCLDK